MAFSSFDDVTSVPKMEAVNRFHGIHSFHDVRSGAKMVALNTKKLAFNAHDDVISVGLRGCCERFSWHLKALMM
jgi:hypothetical protein